MNSQQRIYLEEFKDRVTFDKTEGALYSHEIAVIPDIVKPLVGDTTPDAAVQPKSEQELMAIIGWAYRAGIPATPRGKASSGYGRVIPVKNGIVIDFYHMKEALDIDAEKAMVTVQPGITWEQLDKTLKPHGLTLRLYPTSYPSSSAGDWLAQGVPALVAINMATSFRDDGRRTSR